MSSKLPGRKSTVRSRQVWNRFKQNRGSATLEAAILMPILMLALVSCCFLGLYFFEKLALLDSAVYSARQTALNWDNSRKDPETGSLAGKTQGDGLYWRVFQDRQNASLAKAKTERAGQLALNRLGEGFLKRQVEPIAAVTFENDIIRRTVSVSIKEEAALPWGWMNRLFPAELSAAAKAAVLDPAEYIRIADLAADYLTQVSEFLKNFNGEPRGQKQVRRVVASRLSNVNGNKVYHYPGCPNIRQISSKNLMEFASEEEANAVGYHICVECAKRKMKQEL